MKTKRYFSMKKSGFLLKGMLVGLVLTAFAVSCTNLDEDLYDTITPEDFFNSEESYVSALGSAYTTLTNYASGDPLSVHETSTDEMVVPTRGQDWDDGGHWRRLHLHSWTYEETYFNGAWNFGFEGVNKANQLIYQFETLVEDGMVEEATAAAFIAELRAIRGFFYWQLIDLFGNVPLVLDFATAEAAPANVDRAQVWTTIVADLEEAVPLLNTTVGGTSYGRMNYYAGKPCWPSCT
ncbi:MAG: RagB/SusD family nutrient uptake outer membrane protein [Bacteroidales bacterium]